MAYRLQYSDYSTTAEGPPDPERWVGPPGPQGVPGPQGPQGIPGTAASISTDALNLSRLGSDNQIYTPDAPHDVGTYGLHGGSWLSVLPTTGGTVTGATTFAGPVTLPATASGPWLSLTGGTVSGLTTFSLTGGTALSVTGGASLATNTIDKVIIGATALSGKTHIEFNPTNPGGTSGAFFMNRQGGTASTDAPQVAINTRVDHTSTTGRWSSLAFQTVQAANNYNLWNIYNLTTTNANTSAGSLVGMYSQQVRSSVSSGRGVGQWCHIMENRSQTGLSSSTDGTMLNLEIDIWANGADDSSPQLGRQFIVLALGQNNTSGAECEASTGVSFVNQSGSTVHYKSMLWAAARYSCAVLDTRSASPVSSAANCIWMGTGQKIALDGTGGNPTNSTPPVVTLCSDGTNLVTTGGVSLSGRLTEAVHMTGTAYDSNMTINATAVGSGVNGPATAQTGLTINVTKDSWNTGTPAVGEIDGLNIFCRQGGAGSDCGGVLVNVQNTGLGFVTCAEMTSSTVNPSTSAITKQISVQHGAINSPSNTAMGMVLSALVGPLNTGIIVQDQSGASWSNVLTNTRAGVTNFVLDGGGNISGGNVQIGGAAGTSRHIAMTNGVSPGSPQRWLIETTNTAESGSNAGSNFMISAFSDTGAYLSSPIRIYRASGLVDILNSVYFESTVGFNGTAPIGKPTVSGSKGGNAALASLVSALAAYGLVTDSTT